jgi:CheY-like chemotaxis protein
VDLSLLDGVPGLEIHDGVSLYRNPVQTMDKIKSLIPGLKNQDSLDSFWEGAITDSRLGTVPVYVPNLMDSGRKLLDVVLMNRIIHQAIPDLDVNIKKVVVYYVDITSEDEIRRFIAEDDSTTVEIELRDLKTILDDVVVSDYRMPRMNGIEFMQRIRQINPNARVILLSGFVEPMGLTEENTGADAVIAKSSNEATQLVRWIKRLINRQTVRKPPVSQKKTAARARIPNLAH